MPHIKVKPFESNKLDKLVSSIEMITFWAQEMDVHNDKTAKEELIGVNIDGESFVLELHKREGEYLIKSEKSTRPVDAEKIKKALRIISEKGELEILHDNINSSDTKPPLADIYNKKIEDFEGIDFKGRKIAVEVGFGSGRHLLYQAKSNPDILHIGIEIHTPSAQQVLKQIRLQGLENVWVVNYDARLLLEMLPSNVATMIYVHFPVPWDKKPHRRVINEIFVNEAMRVLHPGGKLELRTDSQRYYEYSLRVFSSLKKARFEVSKNSEAAIRSKYEDRWQKQQKDIYTLCLYASEFSPETNRDFDMRFDLPAKDTLSLTDIPYSSIVKKDYFVHFGKRYRLVGKKGAVIKCSFGSFDRPEHKLLMIEGGNVSYYPHAPVKTAANYKAHQTIGEYICQM